MSNELAPGIQDRRSTIMGYILALLFLALFINTINLPRTALDQRATLRLFHDSLGLIVLLLAAVRLYWYHSDPAMITGMGRNASTASRGETTTKVMPTNTTLAAVMISL